MSESESCKFKESIYAAMEEYRSNPVSSEEIHPSFENYSTRPATSYPTQKSKEGIIALLKKAESIGYRRGQREGITAMNDFQKFLNDLSNPQLPHRKLWEEVSVEDGLPEGTGLVWVIDSNGIPDRYWADYICRNPHKIISWLRPVSGGGLAGRIWKMPT